MAKITDASKLLPSAKSTAITKIGKANFTSPLKISKKSTSIAKGLLGESNQKDAVDVNNKLVRVEKFFQSDLLVSKKKAETKRKEKEKEEFKKEEEKLEAPKEAKKFNLPSLSLPGMSFLDRIKRFLFFTALGWLFTKFQDQLPKLLGVVKLISGVYKFAEGLFGKLFDGFMSLVKFGGDLKEQTLGFIASAKAGVGGNYQKEFDKLEKQFNTFVNASIIAGVLAADIGGAAVDEYNKWKNKNVEPGKPKPGEPSKPKPGEKPKGRPKVTEGKGGEKPTGRPKVTGDVKPGKPPGWWSKILKGPFAKLKGPLSRFAGAAVPGLGAAVGAADAFARFKAGDKIGGTLASISATLDGLAAGSAILALTGFGAAVPAAFGLVSMGIDVVLLIRDIIKAFFPYVPMFSRGGRVVGRYQGGGPVTRGGKPQNAGPSRTLKITKRRPPKITPKQSEPGKDVGGKEKIKILYPDTGRRFITEKEYENWKMVTGSNVSYTQYLVDQRQSEGKRPNPYKALTNTAKILKDIPLVGGLMGAAVDIALGEKPDKQVYKNIAYGIGNLVNNLTNENVNKSISSLMSEIKGFANGGEVPSRERKGTYSTMNAGDLIARVLEPTIGQKVNEAIQSIEKELTLRGKGQGGAPRPGDGAGPGGSPDGGVPGARLRDGSNAQIEADLLEYFTALYGKNAALGIVANMMRESGYRTKTPDNPDYEGIIQWDRKDRWPRYVKWAESKGYDPYNRNAQVQYVAIELKQYGLDDDLKNAKTPEEAAQIFYEKFEKGADTGSYSGSSTEEKHLRFLGEIKKRNPDIGKRTNAVVVRPPTSGFKTGSFASGLYIGSPGDNDGEQTGLNMNLPGGIGTPIYAPFDLVYKTKGTDGNPSVGLQGTAEALGPSGRGFGYYGSYYYTKNGKEYEVLMGHFRDLPYKGSKNGDIIPKGTLLGYQGASGRSVSSSGGVYPHISLHVNGVGFRASNDELVEFANLLGGNKPAPTPAQPATSGAPGTQPGQQPTQKPGVINASNIALVNLNDRISKLKPGEKIVFDRVGSIQVGTGWLGRPQIKYYNSTGSSISKEDFDKLLAPSEVLKKMKYNNTQVRNLQGGGNIPKQSPNRNVSSLRSYPSYADGGMMIAIQPMIIEKPVPVPMGRGGGISFPIAGVNNSTGNTPSLNKG